MSDPRAIVDEQAEDEGLWFVATTAPEAYLQAALRRLHAAVEAADLRPAVAQAIAVRSLAERIADYVETAITYDQWSKRTAMLEAVRIACEDAQSNTLDVIAAVKGTDLRPVIVQAVAELDAEHYESQVGGCSVCLPSRGWPCVTRQVADDLRAALEFPSNEAIDTEDDELGRWDSPNA